jgi:hypothetical protein
MRAANSSSSVTFPQSNCSIYVVYFCGAAQAKSAGKVALWLSELSEEGAFFEWNAANDPQKCPVKGGSREQKTPPMRLNAA